MDSHTLIAVLLTWFLLETKHLIADWFLQGPYQYKNKGTLGHPGGLLHVGIQGAGTLLCALIFSTIMGFGWHLLMLAIFFEMVTHYWMDFTKMNVNRIKGWGPLTHEQFWWWTGFDQYFHHVIYIGMTAMFLLG